MSGKCDILYNAAHAFLVENDIIVPCNRAHVAVAEDLGFYKTEVGVDMARLPSLYYEQSVIVLNDLTLSHVKSS